MEQAKDALLLFSLPTFLLICLFAFVCVFRVLECQGLPIVNGQCDPYATVTLAGPSRQVSHVLQLPFHKDGSSSLV